MPHEAFYATAAGDAVLLGADIVFAGVAAVVAMYALFRLQDRTWERDVVFLAVAGLTGVVVIAGLKVSAARRTSS
ncbi:MAG TPA: hypothetical protein VFK62_07775 [Gaiellaceae bacterium]|nr:hypothetical protein [Gaiellaceae bacterium]